MTPVVNLVHSSARSLTPVEVKVPGIVWNFFTVVHRVHRIWRWYRKAEIYSNPNNFYSLVAGHVLNFALGDNMVVRIAAQCVLIANCITKCVSQIVSLSRTYRKWIHSFGGNDYQCKSMRKTNEIYEGQRGVFKNFFTPIIERIKKVAKATFKLLKSIFKLSMKFMDAIESFSMSPVTQNESINELFINGASFLDKMVKNQQLLLDTLENNKPLVSNILIGIKSSITADQLTETVSKSLSVTSTVQKISNAGGGALKNFAKHAVFGAAALVGVDKHLPKFIVPEDDEVPFLKMESEAPRPRPISLAARDRTNRTSVKKWEIS